MRDQLGLNLASGRFFWLLESVPGEDLACLRGAMGGAWPLRFAGFALTDRVRDAGDPPPVPAAARLGAWSGRQPLVHFSGKDREMGDLHDVVARMAASGMRNMLLLSGDALAASGKCARVRYLESVPAVAAVRSWQPDWLLGVAVNPFKYREEEGMAQYLKLAQKIHAGADFAITQVGFDPRKHEEALAWMAGVSSRPIPLVACVMPLTSKRAHAIRRRALPGVVVGDDWLALLDEDARLPDAGWARALERLALQIVRLRRLGYAGIQLVGVRDVAALRLLGQRICALTRRCAEEQRWWETWDDLTRLSTGRHVAMAPEGGWRLGQRYATPSGAELLRHKMWERIHDVFFADGPLAASMSGVVTAASAQPWSAWLLERIEAAVKHPTLGCETCGQCRLEQTQYICPETCPKGLANGPCGGTLNNRCEFGDRECIHSRRYRIAAVQGRLDQWSRTLVPAIAEADRHRSSWPAWFKKRRDDQ